MIALLLFLAAAPAPAVFDCASRAGGAEGYRAHLKKCGIEEAIALATQLIAFATVNRDVDALAQAPAFGEMEAFLRDWAASNGLAFAVIGKRDAWQMMLGDGGALALIAHADVEPADPKMWRSNPFAAVLQNDKLFGRGSEDDKGPLAAAMVAVASAHAFGLPVAGIRIAIGTAEETDSAPMKRYAALAQARYNVSIDGEFPVVFAQFGYVAWHLRIAPGGGPEASVIERIEAGEFLTQVPGRAQATIIQGAAFAAELKERATKLRLRHTIATAGDTLSVTVEGKSVHASLPEEGDNALLSLAELLRKLPVAHNGYKRLVDMLTDDFGYDCFARKIGLAQEDPMMGKLVIAPTLVRELPDHTIDLGVNLRRPAGMTNEAFRARLHSTAQRLGVTEGYVFVGDPHVADVSGELVTTLLGIYKQHEPGKAEPKIDRGGTYAKLFAGGVDFGPSFPGQPYMGHTDNEFITKRELAAQTEMLGEVILALAVSR